MKFIKIGLRILLVLVLIITTTGFIFENIVIKTFSQEILSKKVSGYFLDEIIYDVDTNTLEKIENSIRNSKYTDKITSKFIKTIIENVAYNQSVSLDISEDVELLILENMPKEIDSEKVENTKEYLLEKITNTEKSLEDNFIYSFGNHYLIILKLYSIFTNVYFKVIMLLLCIINIIGLVILEKHKSLRIMQVIILSIAIFTTIIFVTIKLLSNFIDQRLAGGWLSNINLNMMVIFILIEFIVGFVLFVTRKKFNWNNNEINKK